MQGDAEPDLRGMRRGTMRAVASAGALGGRWSLGAVLLGGMIALDFLRGNRGGGGFFLVGSFDGW
jgi:hypothetical protein